MECYCSHCSAIEEWWVNAVQSDEIVSICRRFPCQYLRYFRGQNMIKKSYINKSQRVVTLFFFPFFTVLDLDINCVRDIRPR